MAKVISNRDLGGNYYLVQTDYKTLTKPGQFYMVRGWKKAPLLSRPLSVFDVNEEGTAFLYEVVGEGTDLLSALKKDDKIELFGPFGNEFPLPEEMDIGFVGGGVGIAPFYYTAKIFKKLRPDLNITLYIGLREDGTSEVVFDDLKDLGIEVVVKHGGFITDIVDYKSHDVIYTCGPKIMMEKVYYMAKEAGTRVMVSLDEVMACGLGACLGCTCETASGNKRVCKDGPIFAGEELYYE